MTGIDFWKMENWKTKKVDKLAGKYRVNTTDLTEIDSRTSL